MSLILDPSGPRTQTKRHAPFSAVLLETPQRTAALMWGREYDPVGQCFCVCRLGEVAQGGEEYG